MKLSLLRHGEPIGGRIYRGNQDDPLTAHLYNAVKLLPNIFTQSKNHH